MNKFTHKFLKVILVTFNSLGGASCSNTGNKSLLTFHCKDEFRCHMKQGEERRGWKSCLLKRWSPESGSSPRQWSCWLKWIWELQSQKATFSSSGRKQIGITLPSVGFLCKIKNILVKEFIDPIRKMEGPPLHITQEGESTTQL